MTYENCSLSVIGITLFMFFISYVFGKDAYAYVRRGIYFHRQEKSLVNSIKFRPQMHSYLQAFLQSSL